MLTINEQRILDELNSLAQIGKTADGGVSRPALSEADLRGRDWFKMQAEAAGFEVRQDSAGNQSAIWHAHNPDARTLLFGSHLDSVPNGGKYDGALGVPGASKTCQATCGKGWGAWVSLSH